MTYKEIQDLIKLINKTDLTEVKIREGEFQIMIRTKHYQEGHTGQVDVPAAIVSAPTPIAAPTAAPTPAPVNPEPAPVAAKPASPSTSTEETKTEANLIPIKSPIVGTFYRSSSPDKPPFVKVGDEIQKGDVVCIVEAMKLFNEIESEVSGKVVKVMVEDASPVEYDQVLYLLDPS